MADGAPAGRYAPKMAGKARLPEGSRPMTRQPPPELLRLGRAALAQPLARRLRDLAREMMAASQRLAGGHISNLEAARRTIDALEGKWRGHRKNPQEHAIREVVHGAASLHIAFRVRRDLAAREVGPGAISWRHVRERVPKDLGRQLRGARGWARVDLLSALPDADRLDLLGEAVSMRRLEALDDRFPNLVFQEGAADAMYRAIRAFAAPGIEGKFDSLFKLFDACGIPAPPTKAALKQLIARASK